MILAIEGIDGAGKNTLVRALAKHAPQKVHTLQFPRYEESVHAQLAQAALYGKMGDLTDSINGMATLFALDRYGAKEQLEAFVDCAEILILDRYIASNAAYSAARAGEKALFDWVYELEVVQLGLPVPDLQILLHTPHELARQRAQQREAQDDSRTRDRYERDSQLQQDTATNYEELARRSWLSPWEIVAPDADPEAVAADIFTVLHEV
ncbi:MAG: dTMP kinase [Corynebacterium sp.]|nr:dTMP kinase [Corynebacterium sp.]